MARVTVEGCLGENVDNRFESSDGVIKRARKLSKRWWRSEQYAVRGQSDRYSALREIAAKLDSNAALLICKNAICRVLISMCRS